MAYTSSEVKQRWNEQHYKATSFKVKKATGEQFVEMCKANNESFRSVFIGIINEFLEENDGEN